MMRRKTGWILFGGVIALAGVLLLLLSPALQRRVDAALIYARGVVEPAGELPSAEAGGGTEAAPVAAATPAAQKGAAQASETPIPARVILDVPDFDPEQDIQGWNNCGPATLAYYLRTFGWQGDQYDIANVLKPRDGDRNVNIEELRDYAAGLQADLSAIYRVGGSVDLLRRLVAAGFPVMVETGFEVEEDFWPDDDNWAGHYLMITGFDDASRLFVTQDVFLGGNIRLGYDDLDRRWQQFNRVYLILYRNDQAAALHSTLAENWDETTNRQLALQAASNETRTDPNNAFAWFNLGTNQVYFEQYTRAAGSYDQARRLGLPQRMLRYQFGPFNAYYFTGRLDDLQTLLDFALKITPNSEEALVWQGLMFQQQGDRNAAQASFQAALAAHPGYADAERALQYLQAGQ